MEAREERAIARLVMQHSTVVWIFVIAKKTLLSDLPCVCILIGETDPFRVRTLEIVIRFNKP